MAETPFLWGRGGRKLTPDQVEREREAASLLAKGAMDYSPVQHWSQGLGRVAQGLLAGIDYRMADKADADIANVNKGLIANLLAGGSSAASPSSSSAIPMSGAAGEISATAPGSTVGATGPEAYRNAIASIESAGSGDYSAVGPTNDKLGRALGRYQIMEANIGPWSQEALGRAVTPEEFLADPALQDAIFDAKFGQYVQQFGPEGAAQAWFAGPGGVGKTEREDVLGTNVGEYGSKFLTALGASPATSPASAAIEAVAPTAEPQLMADFSGSNQLSNAQGGIIPALTGGIPASPEQIARAQAAAQAPIEVAGGGDRVPMAAPGASGVNPAIIEALTNPQATPQTQRLAGILLEQEQRRAMAQEEQRIQAADPMRQIELESAQIKLDQLRNPGPQPLINAGGGAVYNPNTKEWLTAPSNGQEPPKVVELFDEATGQPYKATWNAEAGQYERVGGVKARSGMQLTTNPDGTVTLTEGAIGGLPKLTEAEGRNSGFYGRGVESQKILNSLEGEGTSLFNKVVGGVPVVGNYLKGEDAQKYGQAKRDFINAVLRRESGAVISPEEFANADQQYFPQPGDGPEVIEQKRQNRETTIQGLKISAGQGAAFAVPSQQDGGERKRLKFNPATGELE